MITWQVNISMIFHKISRTNCYKESWFVHHQNLSPKNLLKLLKSNFIINVSMFQTTSFFEFFSGILKNCPRQLLFGSFEREREKCYVFDTLVTKETSFCNRCRCDHFHKCTHSEPGKRPVRFLFDFSGETIFLFFNFISDEIDKDTEKTMEARMETSLHFRIYKFTSTYVQKLYQNTKCN